VFTKVVDTKSVTGAAEQLGLPKSTVSRRLAQLEERLGVRLVQRTTRKLALTEIGEAYYLRCARIVSDVAAAEQLVTDMQATPRGRVRVTSTVDFSMHYLGPIVATFLAEHPDINVELHGTDRVVDLIEEGFDVAVRFGALGESSLVARRLCSVSLALCAAPSYIAKHGAPAHIEELDAHDHLVFTPGPRKQAWTLLCGEATFEFGRPARFASNMVRAVRAHALAGSGVACLPDYMIATDLAAGALVRVLPDWATQPADIHAVITTRNNLPPRLARFLDHLARALNPPPWAQSR
jgi:DNA-binding transcriptional LysR family regulator